ncbi:MAG: NAD(P)H-dependent oxidoreductase [Candidatus Bipolaricaulota bacterium]
MNVGLIIHSQTGNTLSVAQKLEQKLLESSHSVTVERLQPVAEVRPRAKEVEFESLPEIDAYDALVFGAPVHAFSLSPAMQAYLGKLPSLKGKPVACLVTQFFPFAWMGGNRAVRQMRKACEAKGARFCGSGIVHWSRNREHRSAEVVDRLSSCFPA